MQPASVFQPYVSKSFYSGLNPVFEVKIVNFSEFFCVIGHQGHVPGSGDTSDQQTIRPDWLSLFFQMRTHGSRFLRTEEIQLDNAQRQKKF